MPDTLVGEFSLYYFLRDFSYGCTVLTVLVLYIFVCKQSWYDADTTCKSLGGRLPVIASPEENNLLSSITNVRKKKSTQVYCILKG